MRNFESLLKENKYPGRGIVFGKTSNARAAVAAYFIMGRSDNSKNRVFEAEGSGIRTRAFDEATLTDPSLVIYSPVRFCKNMMVVTNGSQTDAICEHIQNGDGFIEALSSWSFEPDEPIYTPRISGVMDLDDGAYSLSLLKADGQKQPNCLRFFFDYEASVPGEGHFIHTYEGDGDPPLPFHGEPVSVAIPADIDSLADMIWESLNEEYKVSLFVRHIDLKTKHHITRIINRNLRSRE